MARLLLINGPNLNLLGTREPERYGHETLGDIERRLQDRARSAGHTLDCTQSNHEGVIVDRIHAARVEDVDVVLINPGALTHTSVALRDALLGTALPFIEIHISNIFAREAFRQHSYLSDVASGIICGFGTAGYDLALSAALQRIDSNT